MLQKKLEALEDERVKTEEIAAKKKQAKADNKKYSINEMMRVSLFSLFLAINRVTGL